MRQSFVRAVLLVSFAGASALAQQAQPQQPAQPVNPPSQGLPPGLQQRQQLPPGLQQQQQLPPGLQGQAGSADATLNQGAQVDVNNPALGTTNYVGQTALPGTNLANRFGTNWNRFQTNLAGWGTNAYQHLSNSWTSLSNRFGGTNFSPTGGGTNRVYSTNSFSMQDEAATPSDRTLLIQIRQVVSAIFVTSGNVNSATMPVHFICREGVVTCVGFVPDQEHKQRCLTLVREVPGVVQVLDELQINAQLAGGGQFGDQAASAPSAASAASAGFAPSAAIVGQDQFKTQDDRRLVLLLREKVQPVIGSSEPWTPVHFACREGVVTLVGFVPNERQKQQIFDVVQHTPGVVQVVNQLQINVNALGGTGDATATGAGSGSSQLQTAPAAGAPNSSSQNNSPTVPTIDRNQNQNLPPGLEKRQDLPPGLPPRQ